MTSLRTAHRDYDAVVVGARCAGAATAMLLARGGLRVLALDRGAYGSDTLSTHALMRGGVLQLSRWGLLDALRVKGTPKIQSTTFHYGPERIEVEIKPRGDLDALYAPRRTLLDALLVDAARDAGAEVRHGVRVKDLTGARDGRVTGVVVDDGSGQGRVIEAGIVIGADGTRSRVAQLTAAPTYARGRHAAAFTYAHYAGLPLSGYHWYFARGATAGVIPTDGGLACVFVGLPPARHERERPHLHDATFERALAEAAPELMPQLRAAQRVSRFTQFSGMPGYLRSCVGPGFALVGDAGSFKDPCTAHGITDALRDAELLARAVLAGGSPAQLAGYQSGRDAHSLRFLELADAVASFAWDLPQVQALHQAFSEEMAREVRMLAALDRPAPEAAA